MTNIGLIQGHPHSWRRGAAKRCGEGCRRSKPAIRDVKTFPCWHICWQTSVASPSAKRASPRRALHWAARIKALDLCHAGWASECIEHCTVHTTLRAEQEHGECKQRTTTYRHCSGRAHTGEGDGAMRTCCHCLRQVLCSAGEEYFDGGM